MDESQAKPPDEPILIPTIASLSIEEIPTLDLQLKLELDQSTERLNPGVHKETEITETQLKENITVEAIPDDVLLLHHNETPEDHEPLLLDDISTKYGDTSGSEPDFASSSEYGTDYEDEETTDDLIRRVTAHRGEPFRPISQRQPLEVVTIPDYIFKEPAPLPETPSSVTDVLFQNEDFVVKRSLIAGWGAFAVRDLKSGDKILVEKPLFNADHTTLFEEFDNLSESMKEVALGLHANSYCKPGLPRIKAIWTTNCFSTGEGDEAGLFPIASRFNHACYPKQNINYSYNNFRKVLEMTVRAEAIKEGEELTISYGMQLTPADLFYRYGFKCRCGGCAGFTDAEEREMW
ncbi:hypothetical protein F53441_11019 [Fusarium austroafricanum]|uniref:SET domain-containing protein n=1 Tax=Fusarium austroafricanum TaxID=2364996 RepID=A0A8H4K770_9HYPO|nr:hypothetical protein F53441_11019 [Fusarium austroafricanum]